MFSTSEQFITHMKLRELRTQRVQSLAAYDELAAREGAARNDPDRVRVLYEGLRRLRFSKQPLHPDVANLDLLLREIDSGHASDETITHWRAQLEKELAQGRLRAEIIYLFGALLEEWATAAEQAAPQDDEQSRVQMELLARAAHPVEIPRERDLLASLFASFGLDNADFASYLRINLERSIYASVTPGELTPILRRISQDRYRSATTRREAQRFFNNDILRRELSDALTILLDNIDEWSWSEDGIPARALLSRTKWRLFLDEDLPIACLLALLGTRWQKAFEKVFEQRQTARRKRLQRLIERQAHDDAVQTGRQASALSLGIASGIDIWDDVDKHIPQPEPEASLDEQLRYWGDYGSIYASRAQRQAGLRDFERFNDYSGEQDTGAMDNVLTLLNAEIQLGRAAFPERPLYVVKIDLKDFYPSLSHDLLLDMLAYFGLAERDLAFFRRYLAVPMRAGDDVVIAHSGVPNHRLLSDLLGELVLRLLDQHIQRSARVSIVRMVDDIGLVAATPEEAVKAWNAVREFCQACGLTVNTEKSGAVCVGTEKPSPELPAGIPTWLHVSLDADGQWTVNEAAFNQYLTQAREQVTRAPSTIARVEAYNAASAYLEHSLALRAPLGETHRRSVSMAVARFHHAFFQESGGIIEALRNLIAERFLDTTSPIHLPEAWLLWPITAGGLGLRQPALLAASFAESFATRKALRVPEERREDWLRRSNDWARYYEALLPEVAPVEPAPNKVMETLVDDFISRGGDLSAGHQTSLSTYWRWVLYVYGPQILEWFGTFRFLFTELVPVQLITQRYFAAGDIEDSESSDGF